MTERSSLQDQIALLFSEKLNMNVPAVDTDLLDTGLVDSLAFVDLLVHLEKEFGIKISLADLEMDNFRCISKIAEFVANLNQVKANTRC